MKVTHNQPAQTILLLQDAYIDMIISKFNFSNLCPVSIPMDLDIQLSATPQTPLKVTCITRPDIAFTVSTVAQYSSKPGLVRWEAMK
ncbi:hypothetical protein PAXRUDRAFT_22732 [Paxillus rubicundulus Ve08.2h10]|uniref:Unplaced genomic scaffold scaffold_6740, whole genome shotgun sequence n=1 Tax=Paxillus rubicundulus Ve08.2h10 TaxID=930991 RepID=A0A0D0D4V5_9AGAM|nr:hypothetical protein PAXRUDRAFT_22732 [Paxillus rubicundulus Ve08.2h10]